MVITNHEVAEKLTAYLQHRITLAQLVHWAENAMLEDEFANDSFDATRDVVARLGVADVRAFGLTWEDCEDLLHRLGYSASVSVVAA